MLHTAVFFGGDLSCHMLPLTPVSSVSFPGWVWVLHGLSTRAIRCTLVLENAQL